MLENDDLDLDMLLAKYLAGDLTEKQKESLHTWWESSDKNKRLFEGLERVWQSRYEEPHYIDAQSMKQKIISASYKKKGSPNVVRRISLAMQYAAVIVVSFGLFLMIYNSQSENQVSKTPTTASVVKKNPPGVKSRIQLSDGSLVWLNADSKLTYDSSFTNTERIVTLEGEAYFEIRKDVDRPFIVKAGNVLTTALGTSFNIRSYPDESTDVSLLTGKVSVEAGSENGELYYLAPNESLNISPDLKKVTKTQFNGNEKILWMENIIAFNNATLAEVIRTLERCYNVSIDTTHYSYHKWEYIGEFSKESLEQILERMGYTQKFDFDITGNKVMIYNKENE